MQTWAITDPGNIREQNQDAYAVINFGHDRMLLVVCDGMGGAKSGNVASKLAVDVFGGEIRRNMRDDLTVDEGKRMMTDAVMLANQAVYEYSQISENYAGMGTTLVAALVCGKTAIVANVGDSRAYLLSSSGVRQISVDHSVVQMMIRRGELTEEEAKTHPVKNLITRAVGTEAKVVCDIFTLPVERGESILLCSDGLSNLLTDQEILFEVVHGVRKERCCQHLLDIAKSRGAPDNVTAVLVCV